MHQPQSRQLAQQQAYIGLGAFFLARQCPYPRRIVSASLQPWLQARPERLIRGTELNLMIRQMQPGAAAGYGAFGQQLLEQTDEPRPVQWQRRETAQPVTVRAQLIGLLLVKGRQLGQHTLLERLPLACSE